VTPLASDRGSDSSEEGGVLASNGELLVRSVRVDSCDLGTFVSELGLASALDPIQMLRIEAEVADLALSLQSAAALVASPEQDRLEALQAELRRWARSETGELARRVWEPLISFSLLSPASDPQP